MPAVHTRFNPVLAYLAEWVPPSLPPSLPLTRYSHI
jgi:hypothetical protein